MSSQVKITLRPPAHRSFLNGYPGIPASNPTSSLLPSDDPLLVLPLQLRPQAHLSGTVEVRPALKGGTRAKWLRVELEKIETVPAQAAPIAGKGKEAKTQARFVELIGNGPGILWEAAQSTSAETERKGRKGKEDDDDGWEPIPEGNYPFFVALPEGLPPSTEVDARGSGISYQIVATLCGKGKRGLLKSSAKVAMVTSSAPILLLKGDLLPTWPAYSPILPTPLPLLLPWANPSGPTTGETREAKISIRGGGPDGREGSGGEVWMKCTRQSGAFGPGDAVQVRVQIGWGGSRPIKLTRLDFVLRETLMFRYPAPPPSNAGAAFKAEPRITSVFTANASVSNDPANPTAFAVLYQAEPVSFDLTGVVPSSHSRVTVRTAKHVDVSYHLKIRAMLEGGEEVSVDGWSVFIGGVGSREAKGLMDEIGWVEGLCERPGLIREPAGLAGPTVRAPAPVAAVTTKNLAESSSITLTTAAAPLPQRMPFASDADARTPPPGLSPLTGISSVTPVNTQQSQSSKARPDSTFGCDVVSTSEQRHSSSPPPPPPMAAGSEYLSAESEKRRLYETAMRTAAAQQQFRVQNADAPSPSSFAGSLSAEEEKTKLFRAAAESRDRLQSSVSGGSINSRTTSPPLANEDEKAALHRAAVIRRDQLQQSLASTLPAKSDTAKSQLFDTAVQTRDELQRSANGGARSPTHSLTPSQSATTPTPQSFPSSRPTTFSTLTQSIPIVPSDGEEKKRLFELAKAAARRRQEEARIEFERQNALLEEMEREEDAMRELELEAERARLTELEAHQAERARLRAEEKRRVQEEFEREQAQRARAAETKWRREEEALQEATHDLQLEDVRRQELQRQAEQRRHAEQLRQHEARVQSMVLMQRSAAASSPTSEQSYEILSQASGYGAVVAPTPQNPASHARLNSRGSFSSSPVSSGRELAIAPQTYPTFGATPDALPRHLTQAGLERSGSSASSFAPTTPMDQANQEFYTNAIANASSLSRNPTANANEKEAYLRSLRERSQVTRNQQGYGHEPRVRHPAHDAAPASFYDPYAQPQAYVPAPPQAPYPIAHYTHQSYSPPPPHPNQPALYTAPPVDPPSFAPPAPPQIHTDMNSRHDFCENYSPSGTARDVRNSPRSPTSQAADVATPALGANATRASATAAGANGPASPGPQQKWKSAIEEKNEERARREEEARAEVRGGKEAAREEESDLPTYDAPANVPLKSAAQEKADLTAHYEAARAAVDAYHRGPPPPPPPQRKLSVGPRQPVYSREQFSPAPTQAMPQSNGGAATAPLDQQPEQSTSNGPQSSYDQNQSPRSSEQYAAPRSLSLIDESRQTARSSVVCASSPPLTTQGTAPGHEDSDGASSDYHRDPQVKSGKQRSRTMDRSSESDDSACWGSAPAQEASAPWMISSPDFGTFSLADGLGSSFGAGSS